MLSKRSSTAVIIGFLLLFFGTQIWMHFSLKRTKPIMQAQLAQAVLAGEAMLVKIGVPPGSTVMEPTIKREVTGGRRGQWRHTRVGVSWTTKWDAPGTPAELGAWYRERMPALGWKEREFSEYHTDFFQDQWLLQVQHNEWYGGRPPHGPIRVTLTWSWTHSLDPDEFWHRVFTPKR